MKQSIAVIAHDCKNGGSVGAVAWRQIIELSHYFQVYVITHDIPPIENEQIHPILLMPKTWNFLRRFCHVPNELSFQMAVRKALKALCIKTAISAVWCHSHGTVVLSAYPLKRTYGFAVVMTTHGDIYERPAGTYDRMLTFYYKRVTPKAYKYSDHVQALSPYMADWAIKNGAQTDRVRVIPNGIDIEDIGASRAPYREAETFLSDGALSILFIGSLLPIKGFDHLVRAVAVLKSLKQPFRVICIGEGPGGENSQALSKKLGVENGIKFLGRLPKKDLHKFYRKADVLCVPSNSDSLPTVVLEAFAMGLPVIGANRGGIPYMLNNGQRGFLFEPGDANSLAYALTDAGKSREKLSDLSRKCSLAAENEFSWSLIGRNLRELLETETEANNK